MSCLSVGLLGLAACGGDSSTSDAEERQQQRVAQEISAGRAVFAEHCADCHAIAGRPRNGSTGEYGPNFDQVKPKAAYVRHRIELGGYGMQSFADELTAREKRAVTAYIVAEGGRDVPRGYAVPAGALSAGEAAFRKFCQSCHTIGDDRRTGRPMWPGTNFNNVGQSPERVQHMIDRGEWWMNAMYDRVPRRAAHDVVEYVVATSGRGPDRYQEP